MPGPQTEPTAPIRRYLTATELLERVLPVCRRTLTRYMQRRHNPIPHMRNGGLVFFDPEAVDQWIQGHSVTRLRLPDETPPAVKRRARG